MQTRIADIAAEVLLERGRSSIGYADPDLLDQIADLAGVTVPPHRRERVLQAISRERRCSGNPDANHRL